MSESEKKLQVREQCQTIGDFLSWLQDHRHVVLCQWGVDVDNRKEVLLPTGRTINQWLADYFMIDLEKLEEERRELLRRLAELLVEHL